jgi:hypothetical protein
MDWIGEIEKHAGALGRPPIFKDAMTTLSFRLEESLKEEINLLAEYLTRQLESKSSAGAVARAFIAAGVEQMRAQYPDLEKFLEQRRIRNDGFDKLSEKSESKVKRPPKARAKDEKLRKSKATDKEALTEWNG